MNAEEKECYLCKKRCAGCHVNCETDKRRREKLEQKKQMIKQQREYDAYFIHRTMIISKIRLAESTR